jgi:hypothetical protein
MIVRRKIFEKYKDYRFSIPYQSGDRVSVRAGEGIKKGQEILTKSGSHITHSFYLPEEIDVQVGKLKEHTNCIDGELVEKGDILAERVMPGGLSVKKVVSPVQGVVDLSRLKSGYLDILGEEEETIVKSSFEGVVEGIDPVDGVNIVSDAYALDLLSVSDADNRNKKNRRIVGEFSVIGNGTDLVLKADEESYRDKVVFTGKYLHPELLYDLFQKGALFVLTYSMDYTDFRRQGLPVGVVGGFGEIHSSKDITKLISSMDGTFVVVDYDENQIFFVTNDKTYLNREGLFVKTAVGSTVISRALSNYGMLGKVVGVEEESNYINVEWESTQRTIINIGSVEFVSI